ncbi:hypothetical protein PtrSN001C_004419 [Pyrenophora tritici-repentis]|nr:hypothetical protein PtrSN001C_004419 [Pyrenophora tritici-repentis]
MFAAFVYKRFLELSQLAVRSELLPTTSAVHVFGSRHDSTINTTTPQISSKNQEKNKGMMLGSGASLGKLRVFMSNTRFPSVFIGDGEMVSIGLISIMHSYPTRFLFDCLVDWMIPFGLLVAEGVVSTVT